jgi:GNAT superfamily N-acetyltransferase
VIRKLTVADTADIIHLGRAMHRESRYMAADFDPGKVVDLVRHVTATPERNFAMVSVQHDRTVGFGAGYATSHYFGHDLIASDYAFYILSPHRGGADGIRLVKAFETWAREIGCRYVSLGVSAGIADPQVESMYYRLGYQDWSRGYRKEIEHV